MFFTVIAKQLCCYSIKASIEMHQRIGVVMFQLYLQKHVGDQIWSMDQRSLTSVPGDTHIFLYYSYLSLQTLLHPQKVLHPVYVLSKLMDFCCIGFLPNSCVDICFLIAALCICHTISVVARAHVESTSALAEGDILWYSYNLNSQSVNAMLFLESLIYSPIL